jgi:TolB-like protein/tetratricopeptide (TPR) repeat protein
MPQKSFFTELRERKVVQVAAIYGAVAWGVTEVVVTFVEQLFLPQWVSTLAVIGFVVGFPVAMFLAWTFDITPDGIERTSAGSRRARVSIGGAALLLVAGTAGLFMLINPTIEDRQKSAAMSGTVPNSIAVLPFEDAGLGPDELHLNSGISDELRDQLGRVQALRIAARSSSIAAQDRTLDAKERASQLGVANLIEGSIRRRGNTLRISVQLIEGHTGLSIWSETFDRAPQELLSAQQAIADRIIAMVLPDQTGIVAKPATRTASANELMLLARYNEKIVRARPEVDTETLLYAIGLYRQAAEADPESALVQSRLASALMYLGDLNGAEAPIFKALSLDPNLSEVQDTLGLYYWMIGLPGAGVAFKRAVELNGNNADALAHLAYWTWFQYNIDGVEDTFRKALELDPLSLSRYADLGVFVGKHGAVEKIRRIIARVQDMFEGVDANLLVANLLDHTGDVDQSIAWVLRTIEMEPANAAHVAYLAELYVDIGDFDTANRLQPEPSIGLLFKMRRYQELIDIAEYMMIEEPDDMEIRYLLGFAYTAIGQHDQAIRILSSTGLPESTYNGARTGAELDGLSAFVDAVFASGEVEVAQAMAERRVKAGTVVSKDWWVDTTDACSASILGNDALALSLLVRIRQSPRLAWDPHLRDLACFKRLAKYPEYNETLAYFDRRRAEIRARLPTTLKAYGVN